jgi:hypothetical protein
MEEIFSGYFDKHSNNNHHYCHCRNIAQLYGFLEFTNQNLSEELRISGLTLTLLFPISLYV